MATAVQQSPTKTFSFAKYRGALQRGPRLPSLVEHLKTDGFDLVPNHPRPLVGRTVASARDAACGESPITRERRGLISASARRCGVQPS